MNHVNKKCYYSKITTFLKDFLIKNKDYWLIKFYANGDSYPYLKLRSFEHY